MHGSPIANFVLAVSIPLVLLLFAVLPRERAVCVAVVGSALFLPEHVVIEVPYLRIDKHSLPALIVALLVMSTPRKLDQSKIGSGFLPGLIISFLVMSVGAVLTNRTPIFVGPGTVIAGLNVTNILPVFVQTLLFHVVPFFLGERVLGDRKGATELLKVISYGGLIYIPLMLIELRVSPQLHFWVYGYHAHDFIQAMREGGYRPLVFTIHGLVATMFIVVAMFSTTVLARLHVPLASVSAKWRSWMMFVVLILSKSMGSLLYACFVTPLLWIASPQLIRRVAGLGTILVLGYPLWRALEWIPIDDILEFFDNQSADRAASLRFRFMNEAELLEKWRQQPLFGTGGGARMAIYNEDGRSFTVFDGTWILALVSSGWWGFLTQFMMYLSPIWFSSRIMKSRAGIGEEDKILVAGLSMIVFISTFELLINSLNNFILPLAAGTLFGLVRSLLGTRQRIQSRT